jgi:hypothetical protein
MFIGGAILREKNKLYWLRNLPRKAKKFPANVSIPRVWDRPTLAVYGPMRKIENVTGC